MENVKFARVGGKSGVDLTEPPTHEFFKGGDGVGVGIRHKDVFDPKPTLLFLVISGNHLCVKIRFRNFGRFLHDGLILHGKLVNDPFVLITNGGVKTGEDDKEDDDGQKRGQTAAHHRIAVLLVKLHLLLLQDVRRVGVSLFEFFKLGSDDLHRAIVFEHRVLLPHVKRRKQDLQKDRKDDDRPSEVADPTIQQINELAYHV